MTWRLVHRNVKIRIVMSTFERIGNAIIVPFMAIYFAQHFGLSWAGILMFLAVLASLLSSFYGGHIADIIGRKVVIVYSELARCIVLLLMALSNSSVFQNTLITFILFVVNNMLIGLTIPAIGAMIIDSTTNETRKFVYTINYWSNNLSLAIGAIIGSFFYQGHLFYLFLYAGFSSLVISLVFAKYVTESKTETQESVPNIQPNVFRKLIQNYNEVFHDTLFLKYVIASLLNLTIELQLGNYISVRLSRQFGQHSFLFFKHYFLAVNGVQMFGIIRAGNTILVVLFATAISRVMKRFSDRIILYIGTAIFTIGYMVLGFSNSFWILVIFTVVFTLGELMYVPIKQVILSELIPEGRRSTYLAVNSLNSRSAAILASFCITLGAVIPPMGMSILFGLMGIVTIGLYHNVLKKSKVAELNVTAKEY